MQPDQIASLLAKVDKIDNEQTRSSAILERIDHELFGNGQPGLLKEIQDDVDELDDKIDKLEYWRSGIVAVLAFIGFAVGLFAAIK